jgi:hypothetical protein
MKPIILFLLLTIAKTLSAQQHPNIILILADDLGYAVANGKASGSMSAKTRTHPLNYTIWKKTRANKRTSPPNTRTSSGK